MCAYSSGRSRVECARMLPAALARSKGKLRSACFTLNNYTDDQVVKIKDIECKYLVIGYEVGEQGTKHLQGYIQFPNPVSFNALRTMLFNAHIEKAKGSPAQNRDYCTKGGDFFEKGEIPKPGKRSDLEKFLDAVKAGERSKRRLLEDHPTVYARYPRYVQECLREYAPRLPVPDITLRPWQAEIIERLKLDAHPRKIFFYVDRTGGAGKSTFSRYLVAMFENVQIIRPGKVQDMAYELREDSRTVIVDVPRSSMEHVQYQFLEYLKDGTVPSCKYESCTKFYLKSLHVMVFCNEEPDMTKLSADRYDITVL